MCIRFVDQDFTLKQPDGTELKVKGTGNQHQATFTTLDGYTVVEDPVTGEYQYATDAGLDQIAPSGVAAADIFTAALTPDDFKAVGKRAGSDPFVSAGLPRSPSRWQKRREQFRNLQLAVLASLAGGGPALAPPQRNTVGKFTGLCLLIEFPDVAAPLSAKQVDDYCNKPGYAEFGNKGSVRDYFLDVSSGNMSYSNIVAPWYKAKKKRSYYTDESIPQPQRARELILEALAWHKSKGFDFSGLSADPDQYIYAINVFYAGKRTNNWAKGLWPHSFHLQSKVKLANGKFAYDYQITDMEADLSLGTFCHENGHMICDFPDLYDYGYESNGVGNYCLMCGGSNSDPKNPTRVGAYLSHAAGWTDDITELSPGKEVKLKAGANEFGILRKSSTEYYIIENRRKAGRDASLPDSGLAVWKVDETGSNSNEAMTAASHYECSLIQADNKFQLEKRINNGGPGDLYAPGGIFGSNSAPPSKWWDGSPSGLELKVDSVTGDIVTIKT